MKTANRVSVAGAVILLGRRVLLRQRRPCANETKRAVVVWSTNSILSDNVRHEALIAKRQNKCPALAGLRVRLPFDFAQGTPSNVEG